MTLSYGFYNSLNGDRRYNAEDMSRLIGSLIIDGVFMNIGEQLMVKENEGMRLSVMPGRAWFNNTWTYVDAIYVIDVPEAEIVLNRIDAVVVEVDTNESSRKNSIKVIKGIPSAVPAKPKLKKEGGIYQHALAYIKVDKEIKNITQSLITNAIGTSETPFVTGILKTMNIDALVDKWEGDWNVWSKEGKEKIEQWIIDETKNLNEWKDSEKLAFETWFKGINTMLDGDIAANLSSRMLVLENEMKVVKQSVSDGKNKLSVAITDKGIPTTGSDSFEVMATNISNIETDPSIGTTTANASDLLDGKKAVSKGELITGTMSNNGLVSKIITTQNGTHKIMPGYYSGGEVKAQFNNLTPSNIKKGVNVGGILGDFSEGIVRTVDTSLYASKRKTSTKVLFEDIPSKAKVIIFEGNIKAGVSGASWGFGFGRNNANTEYKLIAESQLDVRKWVIWIRSICRLNDVSGLTTSADISYSSNPPSLYSGNNACIFYHEGSSSGGGTAYINGTVTVLW